MILGRITADLLVAIPGEVRDALRLKVGDIVAYEVEGERVMMSRSDDPFINPFALFTEWNSDADREAFADL